MTYRKQKIRKSYKKENYPSIEQEIKYLKIKQEILKRDILDLKNKVEELLSLLESYHKSNSIYGSLSKIKRSIQNFFKGNGETDDRYKSSETKNK